MKMAYKIINFYEVKGNIEINYDVIELAEGVYFKDYNIEGIQTTSDIGFASRFPGGSTQRYIDDYLAPYFDEEGNRKEPFLGVAETAELLGWDKRKVSTYLQRGVFPEPLQRLASGPIWTRKQIEEYKVGKQS